MEADWAAEIGPDLEWIDARGPGFVDLRKSPDQIGSIAEAQPGSALREALIALNERGSTLFTCKCDAWVLPVEAIDPLEFECPASEVRAGMASYIDVIARDQGLRASFEQHEAWVRRATARLRRLPVPRGRTDLVIRAAKAKRGNGFGITLYAAGCGADTQAARVAWEAVLRTSVTVTMKEAPRLRASSSIG